MPGTEIVRKQTVLGSAAGIALLAFALCYRFYPVHGHIVLRSSTPVEPTAAPDATLRSAPVTPPAPVVVAPPPPVVQTPPAPVSTEPVAPSPPPTKEIAAALKKADKAFDDGRLYEPKDTNALALYRKVLADDPTNAAAAAGIEKVHNSLLQQASDALDKGDEKTTARLIEVIGSVSKTGDDYTQLALRLKTLRQAAPLLTHAADLMQQGRAIEPAGDNALAVYRQVLALDPTNKLADQGLAQIERDFLDRALAAAAQDDYAGADKILDQAADVRPGSQNLLDTRTRIEGIRRQRAANTMAQANSALDAGDPNLAETLAQKALSLTPDVPGIDEFNKKLRNARLYASFAPGQVITDKFLDRHGAAPQLVVVPTGSFVMGSPDTDAEHRPTESPQREVKIETGFALGRDEISVGDFGAFVADTSYASDAERIGTSTIYDEESGRLIERRGVTWRDDYLGVRATDDLPAIHVSWNDAVAYTKWLSARTGKPYRLPSEAEFEYAVRAGSTTRYPWGDGNPTKPMENLTGDIDRSPHLRRAWAKAFTKYDDGYWGPAPTGKFPLDAFGLRDMDGNVSEWTEDCWHDNYTRAPSDSHAWVNPGCAAHVIRGGSWGSAPDQARSSYRLAAPADTRSARVGFRVARDLL
ncbi:MAG TPA: SUMF1/EgtB/PvdO family nonheme iron enzyme [Rudaea sp.]|nr:SUMF1/EgtB/PvdO family nonheme iron enzyme [Rudaea sp.]